MLKRLRAAGVALVLLATLGIPAPAAASTRLPAAQPAITQASPADPCDTWGGSYNAQAQKASTHAWSNPDVSYIRYGLRANFDPYGTYFSRCDGIGAGDPAGYGAVYAWVGYGDYSDYRRIIQIGVIDCRTTYLDPNAYTNDPCGYGDPGYGLRFAYAYGGNCSGHERGPLVLDLGPADFASHEYKVYFRALDQTWYLSIDGTTRKTLSVTDPAISCWATMSNGNGQMIVSAEIQDITDQPGDLAHKSNFGYINTYWNNAWHTVDWSTCSATAPLHCSLSAPDGSNYNRMYVWSQ